MVEESPLNIHHKERDGAGHHLRRATTLLMREYKERFDPDLDILSVAFTNPLPMERIQAFCASIKGEVSVIEDGCFIQEACLRGGSTSAAGRLVPRRMDARTHRRSSAGNQGRDARAFRTPPP